MDLRPSRQPLCWRPGCSTCLLISSESWGTRGLATSCGESLATCRAMLVVLQQRRNFGLHVECVAPKIGTMPLPSAYSVVVQVRVECLKKMCDWRSKMRLSAHFGDCACSQVPACNIDSAPEEDNITCTRCAEHLVAPSTFALRSAHVFVCTRRR